MLMTLSDHCTCADSQQNGVNKSSTIYLSNLVTAERSGFSIVEWFCSGQLESVVIMPNRVGHSRGAGFVNYDDNLLSQQVVILW